MYNGGRGQSPSRNADMFVTGAGVIFGLTRIRSSVFINVRINSAMQVPDVSGMQRTITPSPKIGRSAVNDSG